MSQSEITVYPLKNHGDVYLAGVHGAGGMLFFGKMARLMGDGIAFHAMQLKGSDGPEKDFNAVDLETLADMMADEIIRRHEGRPIYVCGRFGPIILETGKKLWEKNCPATALMVLDTAAPLYQEPAPSSLLRKTLIKPIRTMLRIPEHIGLSLWAKQKLGIVKPQPPNGRAFARMNGMFTQSYIPKPYDGLIWLIRSENFIDRKSKERHIPGWEKLSGELRVHHTAGTHYTMWQQENLVHLIGTMRTIMQNQGELPEKQV